MATSATIAWKIGVMAISLSSMMPAIVSPTMASTQPPMTLSGIAMREEMKRMNRACHMILMPKCGRGERYREEGGHEQFVSNY